MSKHQVLTLLMVLLRLQTGVSHDCPLRGSTQQLTEADAETHRQTLNEAWGLLWKELGEGLKTLKGVETPQEDQPSQLTWTLGGSQRLSHQPKSTQRLNGGHGTCVADVQLSLLVGPTTGVRAVPKTVPCLWNPFPAGLPRLA